MIWFILDLAGDIGGILFLSWLGYMFLERWLDPKA